MSRATIGFRSVSNSGAGKIGVDYHDNVFRAVPVGVPPRSLNTIIVETGIDHQVDKLL